MVRPDVNAEKSKTYHLTTRPPSEEASHFAKAQSQMDVRTGLGIVSVLIDLIDQEIVLTMILETRLSV